MEKKLRLREIGMLWRNVVSAFRPDLLSAEYNMFLRECAKHSEQKPDELAIKLSQRNPFDYHCAKVIVGSWRAQGLSKKRILDRIYGRERW